MERKTPLATTSFSSAIVRTVISVVALLVTVDCSKQQSQHVRASDLVHKYLQIEESKELTDKNIRDALFKIIPPDSSIAEVFEKMANTGLGTGHCAPGENDGGPFSGMPYCGIRSSEGTCGKEYENYNIHFAIDRKPNMKDLFEPGATQLRDVKVDRWTRKCK